jgi:hypothetical protein
VTPQYSPARHSCCDEQGASGAVARCNSRDTRTECLHVLLQALLDRNGSWGLTECSWPLCGRHWLPGSSFEVGGGPVTWQLGPSLELALGMASLASYVTK